MKLAAKILVGLVAVLHVWFLILEMFLWTTETGLKTFGRTLEQAQDSAVLAGNQGLYNGFLAAGLVWGLITDEETGFRVKRFFLGCVVVAGIYGGITAKPTILLVQALPAAIALGLTWMARNKA